MQGESQFLFNSSALPCSLLVPLFFRFAGKLLTCRLPSDLFNWFRILNKQQLALLGT